MKIIYGYSKYESKVNTAIAFGNFDGVHLGHRAIIDTIQSIATKENLASAVVTFEPHPLMYLQNKCGFLLLDFEQKIKLLECCGIDYLYVISFNKRFSELSPEAFIKDVLVDSYGMKRIVTGHNCSFGYACSGNIDLLYYYSIVYGYKVKTLDPLFVDNILCSSSIVREYLSAGKVKLANRILGRPYQINGKVMRGLARGRIIGFPTVNINIEHILVPKFGVYAASIEVNNNGLWLYGIVNIGLRPTFNDIVFPILEMHVFDFDDDIYDQSVAIRLLEFIRPECKFNDIDKLKQQISNDIIQVKQIL
ncbi:bifunctional riboflavin kinase/FAD synthetase [Ehrlichia ruminantium]|uniref:Riboflavin biosynthesis protein n=1 Tax=Ehrlichia ruminantium TaxID=779 RepID=A0AAE6UJU7_EHRRU|nr:bifunctional riboflavin kinase/FAD synthetase [Ehrlichia ruminantium]QGR02882.1 bifunctional riboflavin kinase/FAD synthetase [Ehrlichia ruminantium]QGR03806.1 bifunctional riboflavin kinase/FAD synthetase [Ehrlichia ruminantium]QGR04733.1 bifunctional riboflavin kinase/FAD synthetase [Ehrlichia ruminantium]